MGTWMASLLTHKYVLSLVNKKITISFMQSSCVVDVAIDNTLFVFVINDNTTTQLQTSEGFNQIKKKITF